VARIAGKEEEREDEQAANQRNVLIATTGGGRYIQRNQCDDNFIEVVVEGT